MLKVMTKTLGNAGALPGAAIVGNPLAVIITYKTIIDFFSCKTPSDFKRRISSWQELKPGDVIGIHRKHKVMPDYDHYGIYAGNLEVIHLSNGRKDFGLKVSVRKDPFSMFKGEDSEVFVVDFDTFNEYIENLSQLEKFRRLPDDTIRKILRRNYNLYSPEETLRRAESKIEKKVGVWNPLNNCEHFALWCKTGVAESSQIRRFLEIKLPTTGDYLETARREPEISTVFKIAFAKP